MYLVEVDNFSDWRKQARELLKRRVSPEAIAWQHSKQNSLLLGEDADSFLSLKIHHPNPSIPSAFFTLANNVACYRDESRWSLLYSVAWRLIFEERNLLDCKVDAQVARLLAMNKAVARDKHKMEAFVRFCLVKNAMNNKTEPDTHSKTAQPSAQEDYFVSWFEPEHLIVPAVTPFFIKRFNNMLWSILTPDLCVHWDLEQVSFTEGITRPPKVEDDLEHLWREYYANIFNPARLKLQAMQSEMPKKYWINLPEAPLIAELTRSAGKQVHAMVSEKPSKPWSKTAKSSYVKNKQKQLRSIME